MKDSRKWKDEPIESLNLSVRSFNALVGVGITTIAELVAHKEGQLLMIKHFGRKSLYEVKDQLAEQGLALGTNVPSRWRPRGLTVMDKRVIENVVTQEVIAYVQRWLESKSNPLRRELEELQAEVQRFRTGNFSSLRPQ